MKSLVLGAAIALLTVGLSSAQMAVPTPPPIVNVPQYLIIISGSTGPGTTTGVAVATLSFPSELACTTAASKIPKQVQQALTTAICVAQQ
jgi:hypothetical protein